MLSRRKFIKAVGQASFLALLPFPKKEPDVQKAVSAKDYNWEKLKENLNIQKSYQLTVDGKEVLILSIGTDRISDVLDACKSLQEACQSVGIDLKKHPVLFTTGDLSMMTRSELLDVLIKKSVSGDWEV